MHGKTVLITGSTDGIGQATALALARLGAHVILHGRNPSKGAAVLAEIERETQPGQASFFEADFTSLQQVRDLAARLLAATPRLDVLINNAGVYMERRVLTADGLETTFAVNHLAPFLLTHLLLDRLTESAQAATAARIVTVSSQTHSSARVEWDNLQGEKRYSGTQAYALSKLGNLLFTFELADRLRGSNTNVTANALHPGVIHTNLLRVGWGGGGASVERGAETPVYLASSPEVEGVSGRYFVNREPRRSSPQSTASALQRRFWEISAELVGLA